MRARLRPTFLRSLTRASRVKSLARFRMGRSSVVGANQRPGDAVANGADLTGNTAADNLDNDVVAAHGVGQAQRRSQASCGARSTAEILRHGLAVDGDRRPCRDTFGPVRPQSCDGRFRSDIAPSQSYLFLSSRLERQWLRLLGSMRMVGARVDLQLAQLLLAERVARKHAAHGGLMMRSGNRWRTSRSMTAVRPPGYPECR